MIQKSTCLLKELSKITSKTPTLLAPFYLLFFSIISYFVTHLTEWEQYLYYVYRSDYLCFNHIMHVHLIMLIKPYLWHCLIQICLDVVLRVGILPFPTFDATIVIQNALVLKSKLYSEQWFLSRYCFNSYELSFIAVI